MSDGAARTANGRLFYARGAETGYARSTKFDRMLKYDKCD